MKFENGINLEDTEGGLLVQQHGEAYVARGWQLTDHTIELVETAIASGLRWMIRSGHPQAHARWPKGKGRVYLAFSPTRENQWSLAIDTYNNQREDYGHAVFCGKYHQQFLDHTIPFIFEKRNKNSGHMVVARQDVLPTIRKLSRIDHRVLYLGRSNYEQEGFVTEYDLQRSIILDWAKTPFATDHRVIGDEFPVDSGHNPRRIDILARACGSGDWLVIEVKRAEAHPDAVHQLEGYLLALGQRDDFLGGQLKGALVAERIPDLVRKLARQTGVSAYEVSYPMSFRQIA